MFMGRLSAVFVLALLHALAQSVTGRLVDLRHEAIANGIVQLRLAGASAAEVIGRTDTDGRFTLPAPIPGTYELTFVAPGFEVPSIRVDVSKDRPTDVAAVVGRPGLRGDGPCAAYEPSTLPIFLQGEPILAPEEKRAPAWQVRSCSSDVPAEQIRSAFDGMQFTIPPSATFNQFTGAGIALYTIPAGAKGKGWLTIEFGNVGPPAAEDAQSPNITWTVRNWACRTASGTDAKGLSSNGRRWRQLKGTFGFAVYSGVDPELAAYFDS